MVNVNENRVFSFTVFYCSSHIYKNPCRFINYLEIFTKILYNGNTLKQNLLYGEFIMKDKNKTEGKKLQNPELPYELFIIAFTLIACAAVILYICLMREPVVVIQKYS